MNVQHRASIAPNAPTLVLPARQIERRGTPLHVWAGLVLWALWAIQIAAPIPWGPLEPIRTSLTWRLATGGGLALYLVVQGYLPYLRVSGEAGGRQLKWHRRLGALAPVFFALHAPSLGYGFLRVLAMCFLINTAFALFGYDLARRSRALWLVWINVHIVAALLLIGLGAVHVVTAIYYE